MSKGIVIAIFVSPAAGSPMQQVAEVEALAGAGLKGDRYATGEGSFNKKTGIGNRQVTLMNARFFENSGFEYIESRRNILVQNVELMWLIGREFQIGAATMRGIKYCDPCMRPTKLAGKTRNFMESFQDCGGLVAEILQGGLIRINDLIVPPPKGY
jgi:MOSC domain-containing protein YiiM